MVEEMIEDSPPKPKQVTSIRIDGFEKVGNTSKYDELGVMDENIKFTSTIDSNHFCKR